MCQRGYTLVESSIAILIASVLVHAGVSTWMGRLRDTNLEGSIGAAQAILSVVETAKQKVVAVDASSDIYVYTYNNLPAGSSVAAFKTAYSVTDNLKEESLFGSPFRITIGTYYSTVTFFVPEANYTPIGVATTPVTGGVDVTVYSEKKARNPGRLTEEARMDRVLLFHEEVR